ncbi:MAG: hypothetical protein OXC71_01205 [Chloroflexi bacterium]|nr:hypothetical protein [Chloroflexota bacterium]
MTGGTAADGSPGTPGEPAGEATATRRLLLARVLAGRADANLYPVRFRAAVIERYRALPDAQVIRTRNVGRVGLPRQWSLDVGIDDEAGELSVPLRDLAGRLPEAERDHWLDHLVDEPGRAGFRGMQFAGAACIDDGEPEAWE